MIRGRALLPALLSLGIFTLAEGALAQGAPPGPGRDEAAPAPPAPHRDEAAPAPAAPHKQHWSAGLGFVGSVVASPGYDPYSKDNTLPMLALFGTFTPWDSRPFQLRIAFEWDYGGSSSTARSEPSNLEIHRLALGLEGRYTPMSRIALFVRGMPAAMHIGASIKDPYLGNTLETGIWTWGVDLTGGAAARIGSIGNSESPVASFWVGLDMGYRFAGTAAMRFRPGDLTEDDQSRHFGEVPLPNLDLSGFLSRLSVSVSF
jgi:hypothetical protein